MTWKLIKENKTTQVWHFSPWGMKASKQTSINEASSFNVTPTEVCETLGKSLPSEHIEILWYTFL